MKTFFGKFHFYREIPCMSNLRLVICLCIDHLMIVIKKYVLGLFRISFFVLFCKQFVYDDQIMYRVFLQSV